MVSAKMRIESFTEILEDLASNDPTGEAASDARTLAGGEWLFSFCTTRLDPAQHDDADAAVDTAFGSYAAADEASPTLSPAALMSEEEQVAAELDLAGAKTLADLARARRSFALHNHPDRVHPALRAAANGRMQLANMLLDRRRREIQPGR